MLLGLFLVCLGEGYVLGLIVCMPALGFCVLSIKVATMGSL